MGTNEDYIQINGAMTLLITGGAGFIGSNFISYIMGAHPDYRVVCVDKLTYAGNMDNLDTVADKENFQFYKVDICDRENIFKIFEAEKPDIVVNFAAESHVDRSIEIPKFSWIQISRGQRC